MSRIPRATALAVVLTSARLAGAYELTTSSTGARVHWQPGTVAFAPALGPAPAGVARAEAETAAAAAIAAWQAAIAIGEVDLVLDSRIEPAPRAADGVNAIRWALTADDPDLERGVLARTFVSYRADDGALLDADIVLNGVDFAWSTEPAGCSNEYDVQSVITHELGHALGMGHAPGHPEATMYATGDACETAKRDLAADDVAGMAELYTPVAGAGCAAGGGGGGGGGAAVLLAVAGLLGRQRRARR